MRPLALAAVCLFASCSAEPRWWKGNLHTHSLWSDGNDFPEVIARWYKDRGYDFLGISDHNTLQDGERWFKVDDVVRRGARTGVQRYREMFGEDWVLTRTTDGKLEVRLRTLAEYRPLLDVPGAFLLVQSEEVTDAFEKRPIHINATNVQGKVVPRHGTSVQDTMRNNLRAIAEHAHEHGVPVVAHLNHPNFQWGITAEDLAAVTEEEFFEIWNGHPDTHQLGDAEHASLEQIWDIANTLRIAELKAPPLFGLGTDDSHNYFSPAGSTPGRGWVMVKSPELTANALCEAMARGDFYASSGVTLDDVAFAGGELRVRIHAEPGVNYVTEFRGTKRGFDSRREPVVKDGEVFAGVTLRYSKDVGQVLATVAGAEAVYHLTGDELYVRAIVTSDQKPANPVWAEQRQQAWTQPVGWR